MTPITIQDVAREAGVSIATVSRYTNGRPGMMSDATRERLRVVIERLGYVPNSAAQTLKTGRTLLVGVVLANIAHPYWSSVLAGVEEECRALGYSILIGTASGSAETETEYLRIFQKQKIDGLLLNPATADERTISRWSSLPYPVIMLDRTYPRLDFPLVAVDNVLASRLAVDHLARLGHRSIGFVSWQINNLSNRQERLQGFTDAMRDAGLAIEATDIVFARESWDDGVTRTVELFDRPDRPTAVFSANGELNLQILAGLKQLGLRVPEDVSVVGFDESPWDGLLDPPLTTVATPARQLGVLAARQLCQAIEGDQKPPRAETRLEPRLVIRQSAAPARLARMTT